MKIHSIADLHGGLTRLWCDKSQVSRRLLERQSLLGASLAAGIMTNGRRTTTEAYAGPSLSRQE